MVLLKKKKFCGEGFKLFLNLCHQEKSLEGLNKLLSLFLTPEERNAIASRVILTRELLNGKKSQREIAASFGISIAKITRGSNMLKAVDSSTINYLITQLCEKHQSF